MKQIKLFSFNDETYYSYMAIHLMRNINHLSTLSENSKKNEKITHKI